MKNVYREKHNYKLSNEDKKTIAISHFLDRTNENTQRLCEEYQVSRRTIYDIANSELGKNAIEQSITNNKSNFTKKIDILIDRALEKISQKLDNDDLSKTTYKDLAVMIGTLYDKSRLENNLSTSNSSININIKVEK